MARRSVSTTSSLLPNSCICSIASARMAWRCKAASTCARMISTSSALASRCVPKSIIWSVILRGFLTFVGVNATLLRCRESIFGTYGPGCDDRRDENRPPIAGLGESVQPRFERAAALVAVARIAGQRLVVALECAAPGPGPDMVAGRRGHRLPAIGARSTDSRYQFGAADFSHGC